MVDTGILPRDLSRLSRAVCEWVLADSEYLSWAPQHRRTGGRLELAPYSFVLSLEIEKARNDELHCARLATWQISQV